MSSPPGEGRREAARLEAFSDGVMAVVITIMAFGLNVPLDTTWHALGDQLPSLLVYVLSFTLIGIYWNNHHHLLRVTHRISGAVMWSNLALLFWLSLIPVATKWVGQAHDASLPASVYGIVSVGAALAYGLLVQSIIRANGRDSAVARGVGSDLKGWLSSSMFAVGIGLAWLNPWIAYALYVAVAVVWLVPDRRLTPQPDLAE
ncbi:MAG TPA: TMEM175 family protein [Candidatus Dormibacteraeota bacterium]|nr:TMEM175 family protein [Candidatus Dormibacteraeota bacterium]